VLRIDGSQLTIKDVLAVARGHLPVGWSQDARLGVEQSHHWVSEILLGNKPVYGINTGYGVFADQVIPPEDSARLNRNLILSHAVCTGALLAKEVVRAAMLVRANTLAKGYSGVRSELIDLLIAMLNGDLVPQVPSQGSLGSSGDLGPLAHLALVMTKDARDREAESGLAEYQARLMTGKAAMQKAGLDRLVLEPKEGLALINGATFTAAIAALAAADAGRLLDTADISLAMSLEALVGNLSPFDSRLNQVRGHPGQVKVAENILWLTRQSQLLTNPCRVQDAYSLRCAPQVHGAVRDTYDFVKETISRELNAATDNPLLFSSHEVLSGGNFHGEPVGLAMDYLAIAVAELGAISERRTFRLTDGNLNCGLPPMLVDHAEAAGLNSGLMMPQYTAASLVLENQTLATPDSVHNLPTSGEQEDHNANAMTAALHCRQVIANTAYILAVELFTAAQALDLRLRDLPGIEPGIGTRAAHGLVRQCCSYYAEDHLWGPEIEKVKNLVLGEELSQLLGHL
jgi:histidine ammonia-lyase